MKLTKNENAVVELVRKHIDLLEADLESRGLLNIGEFVGITSQIESRRMGLYQGSSIKVGLIESAFPPIKLTGADWALIRKSFSIMQEPPSNIRDYLSILGSVKKSKKIKEEMVFWIARINHYFRRLYMPYLIEETEKPGVFTAKKFQLG